MQFLILLQLFMSIKGAKQLHSTLVVQCMKANILYFYLETLFQPAIASAIKYLRAVDSVQTIRTDVMYFADWTHKLDLLTASWKQLNLGIIYIIISFSTGDIIIELQLLEQVFLTSYKGTAQPKIRGAVFSRLSQISFIKNCSQ